MFFMVRLYMCSFCDSYFSYSDAFSIAPVVPSPFLDT